METLEDLNRARVNKLLPNIIWMFVCLFVGIVGNSLVLLVYRLRMKTEMNERYFIPVLAFLDFWSSALSSLHGLMNYFYRLNYPSEILCKFFNFGSFSTSAMSVHVLLLISIQRYRKICVPFGKQMDLFWKRLSFGIVLVISISYSVPVYFTSGLNHWTSKNETVSLCAIDSGDYPIFYKIYYSGVFLIVVSNIVGVIVFYCRIGCSIYKRGRRGKDKRNNCERGGKLISTKRIQTKDSPKTSDSDSSPSTDSSFVSGRENQPAPAAISLKQFVTNIHDTSSEVNKGSSAQRNKDVTKVDETSAKVKSAREEHAKVHINKNEQKNQKWNKTKVNFNKMFGAIIFFYLISYVPTLILFVVISFGGPIDLDVNVFVFINRIYIVNHIINPFVYGYFDFCFRHCVKSLLKCGQ